MIYIRECNGPVAEVLVQTDWSMRHPYMDDNLCFPVRQDMCPHTFAHKFPHAPK